jgi:hypothetical protein
MIHQVQEFLRKPVVWINLLLAVLFNLVTWGMLLINMTPQDHLITLHYTVDFGVDKVGKWSETLLIPTFGVLLILINSGFAMYFGQKAKIVRNFFLVLTVILSILLFLSSLLLVIANLPAQI